MERPRWPSSPQRHYPTNADRKPKGQDVETLTLRRIVILSEAKDPCNLPEQASTEVLRSAQDDNSDLFKAAVTPSTTLRPISAVEIATCIFPAKSAVRAPCESTVDTAFSTHAASASNWNECRNNIATVRIAPRGLAIPFPAMSGAEPCTGSYNPTGPPILADASSPSEPTTPPAWSERMSPNMFSVSRTSTSVGRCTSSMAAESTYWWINFTSGYSLPTR